MPLVRPVERTAQAIAAPQGDRAIWVAHLRMLADPVLKNLAAGTLKARMPVGIMAEGVDVVKVRALADLCAVVFNTNEFVHIP